MKTKVFLLAAAIFASVLAGCGGGDEHGTPVFEAQILSDQPADGNIARDLVLSTDTITMGPATLFFGFDESVATIPEYRAFLDFPLDGSTGGDVVPADATIVSATLEVFVTEMPFGAPVPTFLDRVAYPISGLRSADFDSSLLAPQAFLSFDFLAIDVGNYVAIDVTRLMQEAQAARVVDFQVRFLVDTTASLVGFVGLDDRPSVTITRPLLRVEYL